MQKQLAKERKSVSPVEEGGEVVSFPERSRALTPLIQKNITHSSSNQSLDVALNANRNLTDDFMSMAQESEVINKRRKQVEDELKITQERLQKATEELENKSKVIQQYILRDYATKLQPDEKPKATV